MSVLARSSYGAEHKPLRPCPDACDIPHVLCSFATFTQCYQCPQGTFESTCTGCRSVGLPFLVTCKTRFMPVIFLRSLQHSVIAITNQGITVIKLVNSTYKERQTDGTTAVHCESNASCIPRYTYGNPYHFLLSYIHSSKVITQHGARCFFPRGQRRSTMNSFLFKNFV